MIDWIFADPRLKPFIVITALGVVVKFTWAICALWRFEGRDRSGPDHD